MPPEESEDAVSGAVRTTATRTASPTLSIKDFRHLADVMDRNKCEKFSDYNKKFYNGELDYQIQEKNQIQQKYTVRQKKINDDYEWDR